MSFYCEKCKLICEEEFCDSCGNKKLRPPENNDFCFLIEIDSMFGAMFENILKEERIPCADIPVGNGVRSCFALKLENHRLYVPFEFLSKARQLINELLDTFNETQNRDLIKNVDKLYIVIRSEKKIRKILKLASEESLVDYCKDKIIHADTIAYEGKISSCIKGGCYLFVYKDDEVFIVNSVTYEIISAKKVK